MTFQGQQFSISIYFSVFTNTFYPFLIFRPIWTFGNYHFHFFPIRRVISINIKFLVFFVFGWVSWQTTVRRSAVKEYVCFNFFVWRNSHNNHFFCFVIQFSGKKDFGVSLLSFHRHRMATGPLYGIISPPNFLFHSSSLRLGSSPHMIEKASNEIKKLKEIRLILYTYLSSSGILSIYIREIGGQKRLFLNVLLRLDNGSGRWWEIRHIGHNRSEGDVIQQLQNNFQGLFDFFNSDQIAVVTVSIDSQRHLEINIFVKIVGGGFADVVVDSAGTDPYVPTLWRFRQRRGRPLRRAVFRLVPSPFWCLRELQMRHKATFQSGSNFCTKCSTMSNDHKPGDMVSASCPNSVIPILAAFRAAS